jgi:hypothetical protein
MIKGLTQEQYMSLPVTSLHYPCDVCKKRGDYGSLMRDFKDYTLESDGTITTLENYTALYLCGICHWQMTCDYQALEKEAKRRGGKGFDEKEPGMRGTEEYVH